LIARFAAFFYTHFINHHPPTSPMPFPRLLPVLAILALAPTAPADTLSISKSENGALIKIGDQIFAEYVAADPATNMPYLWPIHGPNQKPMTRSYPMADVEGEQRDHPHQRGLCFGHEDIGGYDTWAERTTFEEQLKGKNAERAAERMKLLGSIRHREFEKLESDGATATLVALSDYLDNAGEKVIIHERRALTFSVHNGKRIIDVDIELIAPEGSSGVVAADKKDSGLSIRVPTSMSVDGGQGGRIVNSEGHTDKDAWAKRARWCSFSGPVEGAVMGVAMLNHPSSFRYPTYWHARTYGLFTANPFGMKSLNPEEEDGAHTILPSAPLKLHHRFVFHEGDEKAADIESLWKTYSQTARP
jgi:hypothetical protein